MDTFGGNRGLDRGLYEALHTRELQDQLAAVPDDDSPELLAEYIAGHAPELLSKTSPGDRVALANTILSSISTDLVEPGPTQFLSLFPQDSLKRRQLRRPSTPLRKPALLTNGKDDPNLAAEPHPVMRT